MGKEISDQEEFAICVECGNSIEKCVCVCPYCGERDKCECALFESINSIFAKKNQKLRK